MTISFLSFVFMYKYLSKDLTYICIDFQPWVFSLSFFFRFYSCDLLFTLIFSFTNIYVTFSWYYSIQKNRLLINKKKTGERFFLFLHWEKLDEWTVICNQSNIYIEIIMTKKFSSWTSSQPLTAKDTESIKINLISTKGDKQNQCKYRFVQ